VALQRLNRFPAGCARGLYKEGSSRMELPGDAAYWVECVATRIMNQIPHRWSRYNRLPDHWFWRNVKLHA
jgi:hypothetical protein